MDNRGGASALERSQPRQYPSGETDSRGKPPEIGPTPNPRAEQFTGGEVSAGAQIEQFAASDTPENTLRHVADMTISEPPPVDDKARDAMIQMQAEAETSRIPVTEADLAAQEQNASSESDHEVSGYLMKTPPGNENYQARTEQASTTPETPEPTIVNPPSPDIPPWDPSMLQNLANRPGHSPGRLSTFLNRARHVVGSIRHAPTPEAPNPENSQDSPEPSIVSRENDNPSVGSFPESRGEVDENGNPVGLMNLDPARRIATENRDRERKERGAVERDDANSPHGEDKTGGVSEAPPENKQASGTNSHEVPEEDMATPDTQTQGKAPEITETSQGSPARVEESATNQASGVESQAPPDFVPRSEQSEVSLTDEQGRPRYVPEGSFSQNSDRETRGPQEQLFSLLEGVNPKVADIVKNVLSNPSAENMQAAASSLLEAAQNSLKAQSESLPSNEKKKIESNNSLLLALGAILIMGIAAANAGVKQER